MYKHILVPLDGSKISEQVVTHATELANQNDRTTRITLLRAVPPLYPSTIEFGTLSQSLSLEDDLMRVEVAIDEYLHNIADILKSEGYTVDTVVRRQEPAEAIVDYAEENNVDLITIATHGRSGVGRWIFGSVTQKVVQGAEAPVLVIRPVAK